jgi:hypothetical protein
MTKKQKIERLEKSGYDVTYAIEYWCVILHKEAWTKIFHSINAAHKFVFNY